LIKNFVPSASFSSNPVIKPTDAAPEEVGDFETVLVKEALKTQFRERSVDEYGRSYGTGRRKTSVARVWIKEGAGQVSINGRSISDYFQFHLRQHAMEAMELTETAGNFDMMCTVKGGGVSGQAGAIRLGIARALEAFEPNLRPLLKTRKPLYSVRHVSIIAFCSSCTIWHSVLFFVLSTGIVDGLLTRDDRKVERKKIGQKKARKKFQWVKR